jgi:transcriptional regulator with XRE-family HTH domain
LHRLGQAFEFPDEPEHLRFVNLPSEHADLLLENLRHLFGSLDHGGKKAVADSLGIDPTTISRWLNGSSKPHSRSLELLARHFGLPANTDLRIAPVFLAFEPLAATERRQWLHSRIDALTQDDLRSLYPALHRLLEER